MFKAIQNYREAFKADTDVLPAPNPTPLPTPEKLALLSAEEQNRIMETWESEWEWKRAHDKEAFEHALRRIKVCAFLQAGLIQYGQVPRRHFSWCPRPHWFHAPTFWEGQKNVMPDMDYM